MVFLEQPSIRVASVMETACFIAQPSGSQLHTQRERERERAIFIAINLSVGVRTSDLLSAPQLLGIYQAQSAPLSILRYLTSGRESRQHAMSPNQAALIPPKHAHMCKI